MPFHLIGTTPETSAETFPSQGVTDLSSSQSDQKKSESNSLKTPSQGETPELCQEARQLDATLIEIDALKDPEQCRKATGALLSMHQEKQREPKVEARHEDISDQDRFPDGAEELDPVQIRNAIRKKLGIAPIDYRDLHQQELGPPVSRDMLRRFDVRTLSDPETLQVLENLERFETWANALCEIVIERIRLRQRSKSGGP